MAAGSERPDGARLMSVARETSQNYVAGVQRAVEFAFPPGHLAPRHPPTSGKAAKRTAPMLRCAVLGLIGFVSGAALAQQMPGPDGASAPLQSAASAEPSKASISLEERLPGDHWTTEARDEITGKVSTQTNVVTEVTPTDISVRVTDNTNNERFSIYDRSWNAVRSGPWQYFPNDGNTGVQAPLTVSKTWAFQFNAVNNTTGVVWKWSGTSKVVGPETVTTKAGTFETFRVETNSSSRNFTDPNRTEELTAQTWYAPAIAHWVKRSWILRSDNHLRSNNTYELVEFGRKQ
jgi:hypothetical protein